MKFVPKGPINNVLALVQIMACRLVGAKSLSEPMMVRLLTHICVTRPQWVNQQSPATMNKSKSLPELHQQCHATWERDLGNHQKYNRGKNEMTRAMLKVKPNQVVSKQELQEKFMVTSLKNLLRMNCLRWFGHVKRSDVQINSPHIKGPGWPKTWKETTQNDKKAWLLEEVDAQDHSFCSYHCVKPKNIQLHVWKMRCKPGKQTTRKKLHQAKPDSKWMQSARIV